MEEITIIQMESTSENTNKQYVVTGDVGGTNFRVRVSEIIYDEVNPNKIKGFKKIREKHYNTQNLTSFADYIDQTIEYVNIKKESVVKIAFGVRGFQQGKCFSDFKNESQEKLKEQFGGVPEVVFMNDVDGMAQSLMYLDNSHFLALTHDKLIDIHYQAPQVKVLFTMGTGTGVSLLLPYPKQIDGKTNWEYMIVSSEAWASYLSADQSNEPQAKASEYMFRKMKTRTSLLKFCKGPSILSLYQFMKDQFPQIDKDEKMLKATKKQLKAESKGKVITQSECITYLAVNGMDEVCEKTIQFLIEIVGCFLQKIALIALPMGGIYIGGGVSNYLSEYFVKHQDIFWKHFLDSPMREAVLEKIPVFIMKENPTLDGLEAFVEKKSDCY